MIARALLVVSVFARAAHGDSAPQPIPEKARQLADRGRAYHDAGDYTNAIAAFKEAYVIAPSPGLLFNLAQAYRLAGDCDDAAWMYHRYLDTNPQADHRALAEAHLQIVEKCGHGGLRLVVAAPKSDVPAPHEPIAIAAVAPDGVAKKRVGEYLAIGGGVALVGAAWFALDAHDASNTVAELYKKGGKWSDIASTNARGQRSATIATYLGIAGGASVIAGAIVYGLGYRDEHVPHVALAPSAHGTEVSLTWGF